MANTKGSTIGAKVLQKEEIEQSLPTYEKLKQQIEAVRPIAKEYRENQSDRDPLQMEFVLPQVINNFAILGKRGTGKSSILKTLYQDLQAQNPVDGGYKKQKNILLPTIIPENLVENVSLMGCILGLLKETVDQICDSRKDRNSICPSGVYPLRRKYNELMQEFVQLQQPYEQISVQQFSTNSEYVRTMTSMLEAGNQFTVRFRHFIDELLKEYAHDALIFIFIDDIDLSTNRCGDLVKTLLSYLSHPAIVTILAGDITIFGEALTMDFLHREQIPDSAFMEKNYLVEKSQYGSETDGEKMLGRKKQLAYEYLKKILPPNNRHVIVNWSLRSKRNFRFVQTDEDAQKQNTLGALLKKLDDQIPLLHNYFEGEEEAENSANERQDALLYYLFDTTARGLTSSYHAIQTLVEKLEECKNDSGETDLDECYGEIKFLIESVVASSYELSISRQLIFNQFLDLGTTLEDATVRFDNFSIWLAQEVPDIGYRQRYIRNEKKETEIGDFSYIELEIKAFQLFVFLDWSTRLLGKKDLLEGAPYKAIKEKVLLLLCVNEYINEGNRYLGLEERNRFYMKLKKGASPLLKILKSYCALSFPAAVRYFQSFDCSFFIDSKHEPSTQDYTEYAIKYVEALNAYYGKGTSALGRCVKENEEMLSLIENFLHFNKGSMALSVLCDDYFYENSEFYKQYISSGCVKCEDDDELTIGFQFGPSSSECLFRQIDDNVSDKTKIYIETLPITEVDSAEGGDDFWELVYWKGKIYPEWKNFVVASSRSNKLIPFYNAYMEYAQEFLSANGSVKKLNEYLETELSEIVANNQTEKRFKEKIRIILKVDEKDLWDIDNRFLGEENFIEMIRKYIVNKLQKLEEKIEPSSWDVKIGISGAQIEYEVFRDSNSGVSNTLATKCKRALRTILGGPNENMPFEQSITTTQYIACILVLNHLIYSNAWYGKEEAKKLRMALEDCKYDVFDYASEQTVREYFFWLHCYCRYQAAHLPDSTCRMLERTGLAMNSVHQGIEESDRSLREEYVDLFAKKLGMDSFNANDFYALFRVRR